MTIAYDKNGNVIELYGITVKGGGEGGVTDHAELTGKSKANQHPISAINGLETALSSKMEQSNYQTEQWQFTLEDGSIVTKNVVLGV